MPVRGPFPCFGRRGPSKSSLWGVIETVAPESQKIKKLSLRAFFSSGGGLLHTLRSGEKGTQSDKEAGAK